MVIAAPPFEPAVNDSNTEAFPGVATNDVGAAGTVRGVTDTADDAAPSPATFTARNLTLYELPFDRPVIVTGDDVTDGENAVQELPSSFEYS